MKKFNIKFFDDALSFFEQIPETDRAKVSASIKMMETNFDNVYTKLLKSPIRELIVKRYRILFFVKKDAIYFVSGFIKKTQKTPPQEIQRAVNVYKMMK
ncbi:MAG: type II toxin-antitoxin system RelE/ParE family toxin [Patescibacteria group bacterium]